MLYLAYSVYIAIHDPFVRSLGLELSRVLIRARSTCANKLKDGREDARRGCTACRVPPASCSDAARRTSHPPRRIYGCGLAPGPALTTHHVSPRAASRGCESKRQEGGWGGGGREGKAIT
eukprot:scaffold23403_cov132-Isochrysis_galbana.AAC.2